MPDPLSELEDALKEQVFIPSVTPVVPEPPIVQKPKKIRKVEPTIGQKKAFDNLSLNGGDKVKAIRDAGYSEAMARTPSKVLESKGFQVLLEQYLPENEVLEKHKELMNASGLDHMVFPLGPEEDDPDHPELMSDMAIKSMLKEVGGTVRRIVHGETARHAYFWCPDNKSRSKALELAYQLRGRLKTTNLNVNLDVAQILEQISGNGEGYFNE